MYTKNTDQIIQINVQKILKDNTQCTLKKYWSDNTDQCTLKILIR